MVCNQSAGFDAKMQPRSTAMNCSTSPRGSLRGRVGLRVALHATSFGRLSFGTEYRVASGRLGDLVGSRADRDPSLAHCCLPCILIKGVYDASSMRTAIRCRTLPAPGTRRGGPTGIRLAHGAIPGGLVERFNAVARPKPIKRLIPLQIERAARSIPRE
jgi:hypothetical protein